MRISVSVIIPVYNVEKYLAACLDSVLCQTLKDIEVLCVNDCSPDNCQDVLAAYSKQDTRIKYIGLNGIYGQSTARNIGIDNAVGEYIFFLDPDDLLFSEESLAHLYSIAKKDNADEVIGAILRWNEKTGEREFGYHKTFLKYSISGGLFQDHQFLRSNVTGCNKLLKRSFINENNLRFNPELKKFEDNPFSWKIHLLAQSISLTLQATYLHRQRSESGPKSIMQSKGKDVKYHVLAAQDMLDFFQNRDEFDDLRHNFDRYIFYYMIMDIKELHSGGLTLEQGKNIFDQYLPVLKRIPGSSLLKIHNYYQQILNSIESGKFVEALRTIIEINENSSEYCINKEGELIRNKLDKICSSKSWQITSPLRKIARKFMSER